jgi:hypothetical protein
MADASGALGAPQVAGAWVNRRGKAKRTMSTVAGAEIGGAVGAAVSAGISGKGSPQPTAETPAFGAFGYLAVSANELVVVKGKQGLTKLKMTDEIVARVPRSDLASVELGEGKLAAPLTVTFTDGGQWDLEVARAHRGAAEQVVAELGG